MLHNSVVFRGRSTNTCMLILSPKLFVQPTIYKDGWHTQPSEFHSYFPPLPEQTPTDLNLKPFHHIIPNGLQLLRNQNLDTNQWAKKDPQALARNLASLSPFLSPHSHRAHVWNSNLETKRWKRWRDHQWEPLLSCNLEFQAGSSFARPGQAR